MKTEGRPGSPRVRERGKHRGRRRTLHRGHSLPQSSGRPRETGKDKRTRGREGGTEGGERERREGREGRREEGEGEGREGERARRGGADGGYRVQEAEGVPEPPAHC